MTGRPRLPRSGGGLGDGGERVFHGHHWKNTDESAAVNKKYENFFGGSAKIGKKSVNEVGGFNI